MLRAGVGYSFRQDSREAAREAAGLAVSRSGRPALTFLFTTVDYDQERVLETVLEETGTAKLVGASGAGIVTREGIKRQGVQVLTLAGDGIVAETALLDIPSGQAAETGRALAEKLLEGFPMKEGTVFLFPDGLSGNLARLLRGVYDLMGPGFQYAGGGTGDNLSFLKTFQMTERGVASGAVAAALVGGCSFAAGIAHGWAPFGPPLLITRARGKEVFEINEQPAFQVYARQLGGICPEDFPFHAARCPLGVPDATGRFIIRDPVRLGAGGAMEFVTEVPCGAVAYLMRFRAVEELLGAALEVVREACRLLPVPQFILLFNCVSRVLLMGERADRELERVREITGDVPVAGMLTFGEIGSFDGGVPLFHNKTFLCVVGGRKLHES
ncbi:FIST signal transduction protein [Desulfovirgula thermocuniculi]|uniref:FIST signal transduction protein n=1 Tax=Desulfovirgula thermocuniculi TaxID=348842 RepID=UPI00042805F8|nr:FIST N-terminal domain-containing protein [Desulfovirgula thermocuniculi]